VWSVETNVDIRSGCVRCDSEDGVEDVVFVVWEELADGVCVVHRARGDWVRMEEDSKRADLDASWAEGGEIQSPTSLAFELLRRASPSSFSDTLYRAGLSLLPSDSRNTHTHTHTHTRDTHAHNTRFTTTHSSLNLGPYSAHSLSLGASISSTSNTR
jgi:hypothetical protein